MTDPLFPDLRHRLSGSIAFHFLSFKRANTSQLILTFIFKDNVKDKITFQRQQHPPQAQLAPYLPPATALLKN